MFDSKQSRSQTHFISLGGNTDLSQKNVFIYVNSLTRSASARVAGGIVIDRSRQRPSAHNIYGQTKKLNPIGNGRCRITADSCWKQGRRLAWNTVPMVANQMQPLTFLCDCRASEIVLLRAFTKLRKAIISFVMSVCLAVRPPTWKNSVPTERICMKFHIWVFFENHAVYEIRKDTDGNVAHAHCVLDT